MNPVELLRLLQFMQIIGRKMDQGIKEIEFDFFPTELSRMTNNFYLGSLSSSRVRSILKEISICGLCIIDDKRIIVTEDIMQNWSSFASKISDDLENPNQRWHELDKFLSDHHDLYGAFSKWMQICLKDNTKKLLSFNGGNPSKEAPPTISTLVEWGLRLNSLQQDFTTEIIYPTDKKFRMRKDGMDAFKKALSEHYSQIQQQSRIDAISLPFLAEKVCSTLKITRDDFTGFLSMVYNDHGDTIWLGTGIIQTYAYEGFASEKQVILEPIGSGPWFSRLFTYSKTDLPQYSINSVPRRFIRIGKEALKE